MAGEVRYRHGVGAVIIGVLVYAPVHSVTADPAEHLPPEGVFVPSLERELVSGDGVLGLLKRVLIHDGGMEVGDGEPLSPVTHPAGFPAYLRDPPLAYDVGADVPLVLQYPQDGGSAPYPVGPGDIMEHLPLGGLVLAGGGDAVLVEFPQYLGDGDAGGGEVKYLLHHTGAFRVRLHAPVAALPVPVGTNCALVFASLHLGVFGAPGLYGQVPAVCLVYHVLHHHVYPAGVPAEAVTVKVITDGDKPGVVDGKYPLHEVPRLDGIPAQAGEVLDDDAAYFVGPHTVNEGLYLRPLKVGPAIPVVHKLEDLRSVSLRQRVGEFVEDAHLLLSWDSHTL